MSRFNLTLFAAFCVSSLACSQALGQVGFGASQTPVTSGGILQVSPVVTRGGTHVRMGVNVGFSQIIDVQTFSPVQNFPGFIPLGGFGGGGFGGGGVGGGPGAGGIGGFNAGADNVIAQHVIKPKPTVDQFVAATKSFDKDENGSLDKEELAKLAEAVVAELRRTPGFNLQKLTGPPRSGRRQSKPPTDKEIHETFVAQCLKHDQNNDDALNAEETKGMAAALIRSLI